MPGFERLPDDTDSNGNIRTTWLYDYDPDGTGLHNIQFFIYVTRYGIKLIGETPEFTDYIPFTEAMRWAVIMLNALQAGRQPYSQVEITMGMMAGWTI